MIPAAVGCCFSAGGEKRKRPSFVEIWAHVSDPPAGGRSESGALHGALNPTISHESQSGALVGATGLPSSSCGVQRGKRPISPKYTPVRCASKGDATTLGSKARARCLGGRQALCYCGCRGHSNVLAGGCRKRCRLKAGCPLALMCQVCFLLFKSMILSSSVALLEINLLFCCCFSRYTTVPVVGTTSVTPLSDRSSLLFIASRVLPEPVP